MSGFERYDDATLATVRTSPLTAAEVAALPDGTELFGEHGLYHLSCGTWHGPRERVVTVAEIVADGAIAIPIPEPEDCPRPDELEDCPHCGGYLNDATECLTCGWWPGAGPRFGRGA